MAEQTEQDMHDTTIYNDLITSLITLKVIRKDIDKTNKLKELSNNTFLSAAYKHYFKNICG